MKNSYIKRITEKDKEMFILFRSLAHLTEEMLIHEAEIAKSRIKGFVTDGYLKKVAYLSEPPTTEVTSVHGLMNQEKKTSHCYRLSKEGTDFVKGELKIELFYRRRNPKIDLCRAEEYFSNRQKDISGSSPRNNINIQILIKGGDKMKVKFYKQIKNEKELIMTKELPLDEIVVYSSVLRDSFKKELESENKEERMLLPAILVEDILVKDEVIREVVIKNRGHRKSLTIPMIDLGL